MHTYIHAYIEWGYQIVKIMFLISTIILNNLHLLIHCLAYVASTKPSTSVLFLFNCTLIASPISIKELNFVKSLFTLKLVLYFYQLWGHPSLWIIIRIIHCLRNITNA